MKKMIAATLVAVALALTPAVVRAEPEYWASAMVRAYHTDRERGYNENTLGIGVEVKTSEKVRWVGGVYNNSFSRASVYFGGSYLPLQFGDLRVGVMGGMISGYKAYNYNFGPMAVGVLSYEKNGKGFNLMVVPPIGSDSRPTWTFGLQLKMRVG